MYNLCDEVQKNTPGRRPANIDQGIHVGLSQISIGASSFTKVLCSMNTQPPSASGMQKSANINMKVIMEKNVNDIKLRYAASDLDLNCLLRPVCPVYLVRSLHIAR